MTGEGVLNRVRSILVAEPFGFSEAPDTYDFGLVPADAIDGACRVTLETGRVQSGMAYSEEHVDLMTVYVAAVGPEPAEKTRELITLADSLVSAIVRDGCGAGDFNVEDNGRRVAIARDPGAGYQVLRLTLPVSYVLTI